MLGFRRRSVVFGSASLTAVIVALGGAVASASPNATNSEVDWPTLSPITAVVPPTVIPVDDLAFLELITLLRQFLPIAAAHELEFSDSLFTELLVQSEIRGMRQPIMITVGGQPAATNTISAVYLPDEGNAFALALTKATQSMIAELQGYGTIQTVAVTDTLGAPLVRPPTAASRSQAREVQPITAATLRQLSAQFDTWLANETAAAEVAAAERQVALRARMVELSRRHGNGRLPSEALCAVPWSPRFTMRCDVIDSLVELNNSFRAHFGRDLQVSSGYRGNPGTSNHGWGLAIDFGGQMTRFGTAEFNWMNANAPNYGWGHAFWARPGGINPQPWHWEAMDEIRELTGRWS
jgi:hypothetical protein